MSLPRVVENKGHMELREDGTLHFENWHIDGGEEYYDSPALALIDAIIVLLENTRAVIKRDGADYINVELIPPTSH